MAQVIFGMLAASWDFFYSLVVYFVDWVFILFLFVCLFFCFLFKCEFLDFVIELLDLKTTLLPRWNRINKEGKVCIYTIQFKDWVLSGLIPHNFIDHLFFLSTLVAGTGWEVSQSWEVHELLKTQLYWASAYWYSR